MSAGSKNVVYAALIGNFTISVIKFIVAVITKSAAMMAESFHSMADMGNQALLLLGMKRSKRPPDKNHPFGYGKEQYFWSFVVANMLFLFGAVASIYEGVNKLIHPHPIEKAYLIYPILIAAIIIEGTSLIVAVKEFNKGRKGKGAIEALKESRDPNIIVVLVEDTAALMGLVIALLGTLSASITGIMAFDAISSIVIGIVLGLVAVFLADEMRRLLIGEGTTEENMKLIVSAIGEIPEVESVGEILTMQLGPESILVNMNLDFRDDIPCGEIENVIDRLEKKIKDSVPEVKNVFIEADCLLNKNLFPKPAVETCPIPQDAVKQD